MVNLFETVSHFDKFRQLNETTKFIETMWRISTIFFEQLDHRFTYNRIYIWYDKCQLDKFKNMESGY